MEGTSTPSRWEQLHEEAERAVGVGRFEDAERLYLQAAAAGESEFGRADERLHRTLEALEHAQYCYLGSYVRAEPTSRRLLTLREEALGSEHPALARDWLSLAQAIELGQGQYEEAERAYRRALDVAEGGLGANHPDVAGPVHQLGQFYRNRQRCAEAEPLMRRLVGLREQNEHTKPGLLVLALLELADVLEKLGNNTEAEVVHRRILVLRERHASSNGDFTLGTTQLRIARLCAERGDDQEAEAWYERALAEFEAQSKRFAELTAKSGSGRAHKGDAPVGYLILREILVGYAALLRRRGADQQADGLDSRAAELGHS